MGYTLFAMVLLVGITWAAEWSTVLNRDPSDGELRTHVRHIRLDVKLIAPLLGAILIMLGIIADRIGGIADR